LVGDRVVPSIEYVKWENEVKEPSKRYSTSRKNERS